MIHPSRTVNKWCRRRITYFNVTRMSDRGYLSGKNLTEAIMGSDKYIEKQTTQNPGYSDDLDIGTLEDQLAKHIAAVNELDKKVRGIKREGVEDTMIELRQELVKLNALSDAASESGKAVESALGVVNEMLEDYKNLVNDTTQDDEEESFQLPQEVQVFEDKDILEKKQRSINDCIKEIKNEADVVDGQIHTLDRMGNGSDSVSIKSVSESVSGIAPEDSPKDMRGIAQDEGKMDLESSGVVKNEATPLFSNRHKENSQKLSKERESASSLSGEGTIEENIGTDEKNGQKRIQVAETRDDGGADVNTNNIGFETDDHANNDAENREVPQNKRERIERTSVVMSFERPIHFSDSLHKFSYDEGVRDKLKGYKDASDIENDLREKFEYFSQKDPILRSPLMRCAEWTVHIDPNGKIERFEPHLTNREKFRTIVGELLLRSGVEKWSDLENMTEESREGAEGATEDVFSFLKTLEENCHAQHSPQMSIVERVFALTKLI